MVGKLLLLVAVVGWTAATLSDGRLDGGTLVLAGLLVVGSIVGAGGSHV